MSDPYVDFLQAQANANTAQKGFYDAQTAQMTSQLQKRTAAKQADLNAESEYLNQDQLMELGGRGEPGEGMLGRAQLRQSQGMAQGMAGRGLAQSGVFNTALKELGATQADQRMKANIEFGRSHDDIIRQLNALGVDAPTQASDYLLNGAKTKTQEYLKGLTGRL